VKHISIVIGMVMSVSAFEVLAVLNADQVSAKSEGLYLYNLNRHTDAAPFLKVAAEAGDRESQYLLGEVLRQQTTFLDDLSQTWFELAAHQNDVYAMMRLFKVDDALCKPLNKCYPESNEFQGWRVAAKRVAESRAAKGDGEAMYQLFLMSGEYDWLIKSAEAGFGQGQYWLSVEYRQGWDVFVVPGRRIKTADKWLLAAANSEYGPAMDELRSILAERGDVRGDVYWTERAAKAGSLSAMINYAAWVADTSDYFRFPLDFVKAYGLTLIIVQAELPSSVSYYERELKKLRKKMTPDQVEAAVYFAEYWKKTYAPLSEFPVKYGL